VFSDEDFTGKWLSLRGSPVNTTTVTAITIGGSDEPRLRVERQLHKKILDGQYEVCSLKSVMRNTKSIFDHFMPVFPINIIQSKERLLSKYWNRPVGIFFTRQSAKTIAQKNLLSKTQLSLHTIEANIQSTIENVGIHPETSGIETGVQYHETSFFTKTEQQVMTTVVSNNIQVFLGHNIQGQVVKNYKESNLEMCCQRILHCIHQLYKGSQSIETER
jgi:hypothetical protein